jgi:hypothetical protein
VKSILFIFYPNRRRRFFILIFVNNSRVNLMEIIYCDGKLAGDNELVRR